MGKGKVGCMAEKITERTAEKGDTAVYDVAVAKLYRFRPSFFLKLCGAEDALLAA